MSKYKAHVKDYWDEDLSDDGKVKERNKERVKVNHLVK